MEDQGFVVQGAAFDLAGPCLRLTDPLVVTMQTPPASDARAALRIRQFPRHMPNHDSFDLACTTSRRPCLPYF